VDCSCGSIRPLDWEGGLGHVSSRQVAGAPLRPLSFQGFFHRVEGGFWSRVTGSRTPLHGTRRVWVYGMDWAGPVRPKSNAPHSSMVRTMRRQSSLLWFADAPLRRDSHRTQVPSDGHQTPIPPGVRPASLRADRTKIDEFSNVKKLIKE
jgi:hypothetical protein